MNIGAIRKKISRSTFRRKCAFLSHKQQALFENRTMVDQRITFFNDRLKLGLFGIRAIQQSRRFIIFKKVTYIILDTLSRNRCQQQIIGVHFAQQGGTSMGWVCQHATGDLKSLTCHEECGGKGRKITAASHAVPLPLRLDKPKLANDWLVDVITLNRI